MINFTTLSSGSLLLHKNKKKDSDDILIIDIF